MWRIFLYTLSSARDDVIYNFLVPRKKIEWETTEVQLQYPINFRLCASASFFRFGKLWSFSFCGIFKYSPSNFIAAWIINSIILLIFLKVSEENINFFEVSKKVKTVTNISHAAISIKIVQSARNGILKFEFQFFEPTQTLIQTEILYCEFFIIYDLDSKMFIESVSASILFDFNE